MSLLFSFSLSFSPAPLSHTVNSPTSGAGGIIVGLVTKYAGGVRKGFSIMAGIILTGVFEWLWFGQEITPQILIVIPVVIISTYVHIKYPVSRHRGSLNLFHRSWSILFFHFTHSHSHFFLSLFLFLSSLSLYRSTYDTFYPHSHGCLVFSLQLVNAFIILPSKTSVGP